MSIDEKALAKVLETTEIRLRDYVNASIREYEAAKSADQPDEYPLPPSGCDCGNCDNETTLQPTKLVPGMVDFKAMQKGWDSRKEQLEYRGDLADAYEAGFYDGWRARHD